MQDKFKVCILLFSFFLLIYYFSSPGETHYNYFERLARSFLSGKLYFSENPPWLNELIPINNKYYVVYPPMPAILMMPLILFSFNMLHQTLFSILIGSINVCLVYLVISRLNFSQKTTIIISIFFAVGTNHWFLSSVGSAWYLAHVVALFFMLMALLETFGKKRFFLIGLFLGAAFWSRTTVILTLPFFFIYFHKEFWPAKKNISRISFFIFPIALFIFLDSLYNYLRFNQFNPLVPYQLIPGIVNDPVFGEGFMNLKFIQRHINAIFFQLPKFSDKFPFVIPSLYASALWFTSPALIYIFRLRRNLLTLASWSAIIPTFFIISLWAGVGYSQFGYRFAQDFMPFLLILTAFGVGNRPSKIAYLLLILSIIVNAWGVILINKLNIWVM